MPTEPFIVPWWGVVPFACLLGSIAAFPLLPRLRDWWKHAGFQLMVALVFGLPPGVWMWLSGRHASVVHALIEYAQFIVLLFSLFVVSGGICVQGDIPATPRNNVILLAIGTALASLIGTTGAAMLMIRPLINVNQQRTQRVHTFVFGIFTIANCGGLLTPLGDPPLFLGMLRGVPFSWTLHLFPEWLFVNGLLLLTYWSLDRCAHRREPQAALRADALEVVPIRLQGTLNIGLLLAIVGAVALLPSVDIPSLLGETGDLPERQFWSRLPVRELAMLSCAAVSLYWGDRRVRYEENNFHFLPILEVAALFLGIFLAMVPALAFLGQEAPRFPLNSLSFLVLSGSLSAVLDNAPTYATFFEIASHLGGEPSVAGVAEVFLVSISLGSVMGGALTYIGNGPNFMVKSIADSHGVPMPSFGGYVFLWSFRYLLPILALMTLVFVVQSASLNLFGLALTALWIGRTLQRGLSAQAVPLPVRPIG